MDTSDLELGASWQPGALHIAHRCGPDVNVDVYYGAQPNWTQEEIDIAFQMDGNYKQEPYTVWLDQVNLLTN